MDKRTGAKPSKKDSSKARQINVLIVEDVEDDALLLVRHLEKSGLRVRHERVDTAVGLRAALKKQAWDIVLCDHGLTGFNSLAALAIVREHGLDMPFIVVSGTIGEEKAADVMRAGVHDLIVKSNLSRLAPAIERELRDAEARRARRRADEELDMERRLLQNLMASLPISIYFKDRQHRYLRLNEAELRILGADSAESVVGKLADDFLPADRNRMRYEEEERIFATGKPLLDRIEEVRRKDGTVRCLAATKAPIRDRDGNIIGLVGVTRDITRRKKAEDALKESEALFRAIIDRAPAAIFINSPDGPYRVVNKMVCDWYAAAFGDIVGKTADDFLGKEVADRIRAQERRVLETKALVEEEAQIPYPDGVTRDVILQKYPILAPKGEILAIGTVIVDLTERKRMEHALRASAMRLSGAINSMQEGFALFDADDRLMAFNGEYERLNPSAAEALEKGLTFEHVIRANVEQGIIGDAVGREEEFIHERMRLHRNPEGPIIRERTDGKIYMLRETRTPEGGIALSVVDITDLKRMEEGLREKTRQLEVVLESMDQGIYAVDADLTCTLINRRYVESHELPPELSRPGVRFADLARFNARKGRYGPGDVEEQVQQRVSLARRNKPLRYEFDLRNGKIVEIRSNPLPDDGFVRTSTDITERKQTEEALRDSKERFRVVLDSSPSAVSLKGKDGRYQLVNRTFCTWMKCQPEEIIGKTVAELFSGQDAKKISDADRAVLTSGKAMVFESKTAHRDGIVRDLVVHKNPIRSTAGEVIAVSTTITDVTEQKRLEDASRRTEARFRIVVDNLPVGINLKDKDGRFVLVNRKFEEWYGKPEGEILGKLTEEIIDEPSAVIDARMKQHRAVLEQGKTMSRQEKKKRANGAIRTMELTKFPIVDADGKAPLVGTVAVDITELKRAEEEIRKLSSVVEQGPAGVIITDTMGTIEYVNQAFTQISGYTADETIGKNPRILKSGETPQKAYESMWATVTAGQPWHGTFHNKRKDGAPFLAGATIFPITADDGSITHFVGTHQDITERVAEQKLLKQAEKMESLGNLAGGIAHDFNNMLLPILALTKMTIKDIPESSGHRGRLEKVVQAATRAKDLVAKILAFSRQEDLKQEPIDLGAILDETLGLLRTTLPSTVTIEETRSLDGAKVFADATQIGTVLMNMATNAADAMEGRPGKLQFSLTRAEIGADDAATPRNAKPGAYAKIRVKDTGRGMDQRTLERIFEPFFTTKEVGKGTGLGLATVYGVIAKHGGTIDVASEIGKGTTFDIYLPLMGAQAGAGDRTSQADFLQSVD